MSRRGLGIATLLILAALVLVIMIVAQVAATGSTAHDILTTSPTTPAAAPVRATGVKCRLGHHRATSSSISDVTVSGACNGNITEGLTCVPQTDDLYFTARQVLDHLHVFYLTLYLEGYPGRPGDYPGATAELQITGPFFVESWTNHAFNLVVDPGGASVQFTAVGLPADAGTGSAGTITISGRAACAPSS